MREGDLGKKSQGQKGLTSQLCEEGGYRKYDPFGEKAEKRDGIWSS